MNLVVRSALISGINALAVALGFLMQILVVRLHPGSPAITDFYFFSISLPQFSLALIGGVVSSVLLPEFVAREGDPIKYKKFRAFVIKIALVAGALFGVLSTFASLYAIKGAWSNDRVLLAGFAGVLTLLGAVVAVHSTTLNSRNQFYLVASLATFPQLFGIILGFSFVDFGVWPFLSGQAVGLLLQLIVLMRADYNGSLMPAGSEVQNSLNLAEIFRKTLTYILMSIGVHFLPVVERFFASNLSSGSVSAIALANRIAASGAPIVLGGVSSIFFSKIARLTRGDRRGVVEQTLVILFRVQLCLAIYVAVLPQLLGLVVPHLVKNAQVVSLMKTLWADYALSGAVMATGGIVGACCNVIFKDYRLQFWIVNTGLAVYAINLYMVEKAGALSLELVARAYLLYFVLTMPAIVCAIAWRDHRVALFRYVVSYGLMVAAWFFNS